MTCKIKNMKIKILTAVCAVVILAACTQKPKEEPLPEMIDRALNVSVQHALKMAEKLAPQDSVLPRTFKDGQMVTSDSRWWCSGFFPGLLWYTWEYSNDPKLLEYAKQFTARVEREKYTTNNHDVGFMLYCSFGNGLRLTGDSLYPEVLLTGTKSLATRYKPQVGLIKSWDSNPDKWQFPVIIDNMMNLELMMWAAKTSGDSTFSKIAFSHADKTIENHYRPDNSCWHVVSYDTITGVPHIKQTHQGFSDESAWSRGQAWGLYGYTMMFRETGNQRYLEQAEKVAGFLMNNPNMPADGVPYWDFNAPGIPNEPRDASAAAIMASALVELSTLTQGEQSKQYLSFAEKQLRTLASPEYLAKPGENGDFILMHSTGSKPHNSEVDVPLTYADYYFVEALLRLKKLQENK